MSKPTRFIYLNAYAFLLLLGGIAVSGIPLFRIAVFLCVPQAIVAIFFFKTSYGLFSAWPDKKRMYAVLMGKNRMGLSPESFKTYMRAPCGRLMVKAVLRDLCLDGEYTKLLAYREPILVSIKANCAPVETSIYIDEEALKTL